MSDTRWDAASNGMLEERFYYCQNWRHDVVAVVDANGGGQQVEQVRYEAYGVPFLILAGDTDSDGSMLAADLTQIQTWIDTFAYDVRGDVDLDGDVDATDKSTVQNTPSPKSGGRGQFTHANTANRKGYAGYEFDDEFVHDVYHVRYRVLNSSLGQWTRRDPVGYVDGANVYKYSRPINSVDPHGLLSVDCPLGSPGCGSNSQPCVSAALAANGTANAKSSSGQDDEFKPYDECRDAVESQLPTILNKPCAEQARSISMQCCYESGIVRPNIADALECALRRRATDLEDTFGCNAVHDFICSNPAMLLNASACARDCCVAHDSCFSANGCTAPDSWLGLEGDACFQCNKDVVFCIAECATRNVLMRICSIFLR